MFPNSTPMNLTPELKCKYCKKLLFTIISTDMDEFYGICDNCGVGVNIQIAKFDKKIITKDKD